MPNDERILETMPTGTLGLIPTASCMELGKKVDSYLSTWREHREHEHHDDIAFKEYHKESYIMSLIFHVLVPEKRNVSSISLSGATTFILWSMSPITV